MFRVNQASMFVRELFHEGNFRQKFLHVELIGEGRGREETVGGCRIADRLKTAELETEASSWDVVMAKRGF